MKFDGKKISISAGRVSSARKTDDGIVFIVDDGGALQEKIIPKNSNKFVFRLGKIVSYADDCFILSSGKIERRGKMTYAPNSTN